MTMLMSVLNRKIQELKKNNIRFQVIGRKENLSAAVLNAFQKAVQETQDNTGLIVNLAFNYGARLEIVDAARSLAEAVKSGRMAVEDIDEASFARALYTQDLPDPDLLIRTSGEKRISNFLLWQLSYTELYFTQTYWPDFTAQEFQKAIDDYRRRERRYGDLTAEA